jgi:hypothetical protein
MHRHRLKKADFLTEIIDTQRDSVLMHFLVLNMLRPINAYSKMRIETS